jgi:glycosyltransferase involved in cell wall biosynthesis
MLTIKNKIINMISINLTIHNKAFLLNRVLDGIKNNTIDPYELIIVLDGCTDESESIVDKFIHSNSSIKTKKLYAPNVFETKANNIAAKNSEGDYIIIVQDDMIVKEYGWNLRMLKPIEAFNDVFAVTSRTAHNWILNSNSKDVNKDDFHGNDWADILFHTDHADRNNITRETFALRDSVNRGPLLLKHNVLQELNYFDEEFSPQDMDDHDLCYRAFKKGYKSGCYWIDFESQDSWGGTREENKPKKWLLMSNFKNQKIVLSRHKDLICGEKRNENRLLN